MCGVCFLQLASGRFSVTLTVDCRLTRLVGIAYLECHSVGGPPRFHLCPSVYPVCTQSDGHRLGRQAAPQAGGRVASWTSSSFPTSFDHLVGAAEQW